MKLFIDREPKTISLVGNNALKYREGKPEVRAYDSCYYEINPSKEMELTTTWMESIDLRLILNIKKLKNMNVYVYQGMNKYNATVPINDN